MQWVFIFIYITVILENCGIQNYKLLHHVLKNDPDQQYNRVTKITSLHNYEFTVQKKLITALHNGIHMCKIFYFAHVISSFIVFSLLQFEVCQVLLERLNKLKSISVQQRGKNEKKMIVPVAVQFQIKKKPKGKNRNKRLHHIHVCMQCTY